MSVRGSFLCTWLLIMAGTAGAEIITVPTDQPTIQAGIDAASDGDTVSVLPGVYTENIDYSGKAVWVIAAGDVASVILQPAAPTTPIVSVVSGEGAGAALEGFTVRNGAGGGVVVANGAHMEIKGNIFTGFTGDSAVVMFSRGSGNTNVRISRNVLTGNFNWACMYGWLGTDSVVIVNNTLWDNAGGIVLMDLAPAYTVVKNNIVANCCDRHGEGEFSSRHVYNDRWNGKPECSRIEYSGGLNGCFDPRFVDPSAGDFRLRPESPCIDAGDPSAMYVDPDGSPSDMGAIPYTGVTYPVAIDLNFGEGRFNNVTPTLTPAFYWSYFDTAVTSQMQWQVQVSSDSTWAAIDLWDSGPVFSSDTIATYGGADLRPYRKYHVRVRVGNGSGWGDWRYSAFNPISDDVFLVPSDYPDLRAAMDLVTDYDTIVVDSGIYSGSGWVNLTAPIAPEWGAELTIIGGHGPELTRIECDGSDFIRVDSTRRLTIRGVAVVGAGVALKREMHANITAVNCNFEGNGTVIQDDWWYGAITVDSCRFIGNDIALSYVEIESYWTIQRSLFRNNGMAFYCLQTNGAVVSDNVFVGNSVALRMGQGSYNITRNIISANGWGLHTPQAPWGAFFTCNDVFGNQMNYVGVVPDQTGLNGNISLDPDFCDTTAGFQFVTTASPCLAENNECGQTMGYVVSGCSCCELRGDITHSGDIAVSDLTALIAYLFRGGAAPFCAEEANIDGSGDVTVADLTALVAYLFRAGAAPAPCPVTE